MAEPLLPNYQLWPVYTLEPSKSGIIKSVDSGGTPSTKEESYWDGDVAWLTPKELSNNGKIFLSDTERKISDNGLKNSSAKLMPPYSVLLTKRAPVGLVAVNTVPMSTNQGFLNFQVHEKIRPLYLAYWLKSNTEYLHAIANGSTYDELYKGDLFEFEISVPTLKEQDQIIEIINALQFQVKLAIPLELFYPEADDLNKLRLQSQRLDNLLTKITLMLLSGQINVKELADKLQKVEQNAN